MNNQVITSEFPRALLALAMVVAALSSSPTAGAVPPPQFGARTSFPIGSSPYSMIVADFNKDGTADVATTGFSGVVLLLGLGNGTFTGTTNSSPAGRSLMATGDFNNDKNLDLMVLGDYGGSVLLGDGSGKFPVVTNSVFANYPAAVAIGDFNGDGKLDVATGDLSRAVKVAFGRGDGSFGTSTTCPLSNYVSDIRTGDLNGNGRLDLVVALRSASSTDSNTVCVLTNNGDGTFAAQRYYGGAPGGTEYQRSLELADLKGDGALDLVLLNRELDRDAGSVTIRLNSGAGVFGPPIDYSVGFAPSSIASADFNGDGNVDLIVRDNGVATVLLGHGDGSFTVSSQMFVPSDSGRNHTVGVGDFNGDGMPDIAFLDSSGGAVAVMLNKTPPLLKLTPMPGYNQLSWLTTFGAGYTLEYTTNLTVRSGWQAFPYPPVVVGNLKAVTDWDDQGRKFYRLRKP
jgi:hypothetical protein